MTQEDFAAFPSQREQIWTFKTINMNRGDISLLRRKHGIEKITPKIHELVFMDNYTELRY